MGTDAVPAIEGNYSQDDRDVTVRHTCYDSVSFQRGLGDSGHRIQIVETECPQCSHETMLREWRVNPTMRDVVGYFCNNPACRYYHKGEFDYAMAYGPVDSGDRITRYANE